MSKNRNKKQVRLKKDFSLLDKRLDSDLRLMVFIEKASHKICDVRIKKLKQYQSLSKRTIICMANKERSPKLKKALNDTFKAVVAKSDDLMKLVVRMKDHVIPSLLSTHKLISKMKSEVKHCKSNNNEIMVSELCHQWYLYEKQRLLCYTNYVKYCANGEMYFSANSVTNFNRAIKHIGEMDINKQLLISFAKWAVSPAVEQKFRQEARDREMKKRLLEEGKKAIEGGALGSNDPKRSMMNKALLGFVQKAMKHRKPREEQEKESNESDGDEGDDSEESSDEDEESSEEESEEDR